MRISLGQVIAQDSPRNAGVEHRTCQRLTNNSHLQRVGHQKATRVRIRAQLNRSGQLSPFSSANHQSITRGESTHYQKEENVRKVAPHQEESTAVPERPQRHKNGITGKSVKSNARSLTFLSCRTRPSLKTTKRATTISINCNISLF